MSRRGTRDLPDQIWEIAHMDHAACTKALAALPGITLPSRLRAQTLRRLLAYGIQARALGGLSPKERRALKAIAGGTSACDVGATTPSAGTHLLREWNGRTYRVEVTDRGYVLDDTTYGSLSAVAKRITGTSWSGPRFFGLAKKRSAFRRPAAQSTPASRARRAWTKASTRSMRSTRPARPISRARGTRAGCWSKGATMMVESPAAISIVRHSNA